MNKNILMMAFAKGQISEEGSQIKKYIGTGVVKVLCVNPTKAQIKEYMGYEPQNEPSYTGVQEIDGKQINYARISFIVRTTPDKSNGIETTQMMSYFIRNQYRKGSTSGKYQVIDYYGNTAWGTEEDIRAKNQIMYSNGPAKIIGEYRPLFLGESQLVRFLQEYLVIGAFKGSSGYDYINGTWIPKQGDELKECECYFTTEEIQKMFKGDFSCIKDAISLQPNNEFKVLFGIRTTDDGKEYQDIYNRPLRLRTNDWSEIQKEIEETKNNGGLQNKTYEFCELKEYKVTPTEFNKEESVNDPFANAGAESPWN